MPIDPFETYWERIIVKNPMLRHTDVHINMSSVEFKIQLRKAFNAALDLRSKNFNSLFGDIFK